jgi:glucose-6-phosphate 1-dehydrogenase
LEILMPVTERVPMGDFVILGVAGDLAVRKLLSALHRCDRDS